MKAWPVLKCYTGKQLRRIALPVGGIGTGTVSLGGRGNLQDWAIMNTPAIGYTPVMTKGMKNTGPFFALYTETKGQKKTTVLEGALDTEDYDASEGSKAVNHGLPRFRHCEFASAYPLGQVHLKDDEVPLDVTISAFNPLIPGDSDRSGIPVAILTYTLKNNYGPNPQMQGWYLGALKSASEMAKAIGDNDFSVRCLRLYEKGSRYMDEELFNGEYYEHKIEVPKKIRRHLTHDMGSDDLSNPILQLGAGCLVDQLVGQYMSHTLGLGYLTKEENIKKTLESVMKYNYKENFHNHFNHMRSYVLGDESGLLMATYPRGNRPDQPFPYFNEVMTGFEHSTAAHMLYEGMTESGLKVIESIRDRYDGHKRNPFDEAECGHHYARAMAAWSEMLAVTGFYFSAVKKEMTFTAQEGQFFWSTGYAWGTCSISKEDTWKVKLSVLFGDLSIDSFTLASIGSCVDVPKLNKQKEFYSFEIASEPVKEYKTSGKIK